MAATKKTVGTVKKTYILHGWSYETDKWAPFVGELKARGITGTLLQIPGLTAQVTKPWTAQDYVDWLDRKIPDEDGPVVLTGHSNGGRIALWYAASHPDKVSRLILIDSAGMPHNSARARLKRMTFRMLAKTGKKFTGSATLRHLLYRLAGVRDYDEASAVMKQTMVNLLKDDIKLPLEKIRVPVTLIWGADDRITPLSDARIMERRLPASELHVISGARHAPQFSHPTDVAGIVSGNIAV